MVNNETLEMLFAYFNLPMAEYVEMLKAISGRGGLTSADISWLENYVPYGHFSAMLRQLEPIGLETG